MFQRARDPDVFPPSVSLWSVAIPADAAFDPPLAGLDLPRSLERAVPKRKIQFLAGRLCAREAVRRLAPGAAGVGTLPRDADGCPVWPPGLVGSIAHTDGFATAAVAKAGAAQGLGVDVEPVMSRQAAADLTRFVASEDERLRVAEAGLDSLEGLTLIFSAKESLYKALFPADRRRFDFLDCAVVRVDERGFSIRLTARYAAVFGSAEFSGGWELVDGAMRTGVTAA